MTDVFVVYLLHEDHQDVWPDYKNKGCCYFEDSYHILDIAHEKSECVWLIPTWGAFERASV